MTDERLSLDESRGPAATPGQVRSVCVFCGSAPGRQAHFVEAARVTGRLLAQSGIALVYGGGHIGMIPAAVGKPLV